MARLSFCGSSSLSGRWRNEAGTEGNEGMDGRAGSEGRARWKRRSASVPADVERRWRLRTSATADASADLGCGEGAGSAGVSEGPSEDMGHARRVAAALREGCITARALAASSMMESSSGSAQSSGSRSGSASRVGNGAGEASRGAPGDCRSRTRSAMAIGMLT